MAPKAAHGQKRKQDTMNALILIDLCMNIKIDTKMPHAPLVQQKKFKCETCDKAFSRKNDLSRHMQTHTGEKPHVCETCGKAFARYSDLTMHMRTHSGVKPHVCKTCDKAFSQSGHLAMHLRTHSGEKPFVCETCGMAFSKSNTLVRHMRTHTREQPYECKTCGKAFSESGHLARHTRTHTREQPYECKTCGKVFSRSDSRTSHVIYQHTDRDSIEYKEFTGKSNVYRRQMYAMNSEFKAARTSRGALKRFLKRNGGTKSAHTEDLVGCTWKELVAHLNDNPYGYYVGQYGVHVDHIRCIASFMLFSGPIAQRECMNFNNLQLMWGTDNIAKGSDYNAEEYANSDAGKAISKLRVGWEKEFPTNEAGVDDYDSDDEDDSE
jgi:uncharacterized C2H2 Zn-finger protein